MAASAKEAPRVGHALPSDKDILAAVGTIALRHAQLDNALRMTIKDLSGIDQAEALHATLRDGSRELGERIRKLARRKLGEGAPLLRLQALLTRASHVTRRRNELMHAVWGTEIDGGPMMRGDDHEFRPIPTAAELGKLDDEIVEVLDDLTQARLFGFLYEALHYPPAAR